MVKMHNARGGHRGKQKPRPLFPPGELPLFGPPPAFMRRPPGPPIPPTRGPMGPYGEFGPPPPPPPPLRPPHLGPPIPPMHPMSMRRRPGPPPPMPLLQAPVLPPRHLPFIRGRPMHPRLGPGRKFGAKSMKKGKTKKNRKPNTGKTEESKKTEAKKEENENILEGPWINDAIKAEIEKMNELKATSETSKTEADVKLYKEQREKVQSMATSAKLEYIGSQTENKGDFFCEVCDRSWITEEELEEHKAEHVKCHYEGCVYTAAPKLVTLHVRLQHESGVFEKIIQTYDEEEIRKWKEERKRNYPTLENIQRKLEQMREMKERGEKLLERNKPFKTGSGFSIMKGKLGKENGNMKDRKRKRKRPKKSVENKKLNFLSTVSVTDDMIPEGTHGTKTSDNIEDEEWLEDMKPVKVEVAPVSKVLMALCASYASDSEDGMEEDSSKKTQSIGPCDENDAPTEIKISRKNDDIPNIHVEMSEKSENKNREKPVKNDTISKKTKNNTTSVSLTTMKASFRKRPLTLLEKLLSKEIRQERNHILQCIHYIIQENYFKNSKKDL